MKSLTNRSSKPVRPVVQGVMDPRVEAERRDLKTTQKYLLDVLQQLGCSETRRGAIFDGLRERSPDVTIKSNAPRRGAGPIGDRGLVRKMMCYRCRCEGHSAKECDQPRLPVDAPSQKARRR